MSTGKWSSDAHGPLCLLTGFSFSGSPGRKPLLDSAPPLATDPFSLLAFPARFLEGVVYTLCLHFLSTHSLLNPLQSGFQATEQLSPRSPGTSLLPHPRASSKVPSPCSLFCSHTVEHCCLLELLLGSALFWSTFYLHSLASWALEAPLLSALPRVGTLPRLAYAAGQHILPQHLQYLLRVLPFLPPLHGRAHHSHCFNCHLHANDIRGKT